MGVPVGEAEGEYPALLRCTDCNTEYETDETMPNDCPNCHHLQWEEITPDGAGYTPSEWREEFDQ